MKKDILYILFVLVGIAVGYFITVIGDVSGWNLFWELFYGGILGGIVGVAFLEKQYGILVGAAIGLVASASLDILAGSPLTIRDKLGDMFIGSLIGWNFTMFLRQMLIGGVVGGILGFGWGMIHSHRVGHVGFQPGDGVILLAIAWFVLGMIVGKWYMIVFGYRFLDSFKQEE